MGMPFLKNFEYHLTRFIFEKNEQIIKIHLRILTLVNPIAIGGPNMTHSNQPLKEKQR